MRKWFNVLFYIICFFVMAAVIYRLAFVTPPQPEESSYIKFCLGAAGLAGLCAASSVGFAALADWIVCRKKAQEYQREQKRKDCSGEHRED